jgi:hypothetical protein
VDEAIKTALSQLLQVGALCQARSLQLSAHCRPSLHVHPCCALIPFRPLEYFHDHMRIEHLLFDGALRSVNGELRPDLTRPGLGPEFKRPGAERFCVWAAGEQECRKQETVAKTMLQR